MNIIKKIKLFMGVVVFNFAFFIATNSTGLFCINGLMEEPDAPEALLNR